MSKRDEKQWKIGSYHLDLMQAAQNSTDAMRNAASLFNSIRESMSSFIKMQGESLDMMRVLQNEMRFIHGGEISHLVETDDVSGDETDVDVTDESRFLKALERIGNESDLFVKLRLLCRLANKCDDVAKSYRSKSVSLESRKNDGCNANESSQAGKMFELVTHMASVMEDRLGTVSELAYGVKRKILKRVDAMMDGTTLRFKGETIERKTK